MHPRAQHLLDFIGQHEAPKGFDQYYGRIRPEDAPPKPLTQMTVAQVLAWQDSIDPKYNSEAAGRFQFLEDTLRDLVQRGAASGGDPFDEATQYRLAFVLLRGAGWDRYVKGLISEDRLGNGVAAVWASMPMLSGPKKGRSRYDGDGLNSALCSVAEYRRAIRGFA